MSAGIATGVEVRAGDDAGVLTPSALELVDTLERELGERRHELLRARAERQERISAGELPDFLTATASLRQGDWRVAPVPADLLGGRGVLHGGHAWAP